MSRNEYVSVKMQYLTAIEPCKFAYYFSFCDQMPLRVFFAAVLIFSLPFTFVAAKMMRTISIIRNRKYIPGLGYVVTVTVKFIVELFSNYVLYTEFHIFDYDLSYKLSFMTFDLYIFSLTHFLVCVCNVLLVFGLFGSKILYYGSTLLKYFFLAAFIFRFVFSFIPMPFEFIRFVYRLAGSYDIMVNIMRVIIWTFSIVILSILFVFSTFDHYLPKKLRKPMKLALIYYPVGIFISLTAELLSEAKFMLNNQLYINFQYLFFFIKILEFFACNIGILFIIALTSNQNLGVEEEEKIHELDQAIDLAISL